MDVESRKRWVDYSRAKDVMFEHTDRKKTLWHVVNADNKKQARLNCIRHLLNQIPYQDMRPVQIDLPLRQADTGYRRPKKSTHVSSRSSIELTSLLRCEARSAMLRAHSEWWCVRILERLFAALHVAVCGMPSAPDDVRFRGKTGSRLLLSIALLAGLSGVAFGQTHPRRKSHRAQSYALAWSPSRCLAAWPSQSRGSLDRNSARPSNQ